MSFSSNVVMYYDIASYMDELRPSLTHIGTVPDVWKLETYKSHHLLMVF